MSSTFKIATVAATDPIIERWEQIAAPVNAMIAARVLSRMRSAILEFPVLTSAQYAQWLAVCDIDTTNAPYMPRRTDAVYTTSPEAFTGTAKPPGIDLAYTTPYRYHFLGSRHSTGVYLYDTQIQVYMTRQYTFEAGNGL